MLMRKTLSFIFGISTAVLLSGPASRADTARLGQLPSPDKKFVDDAVVGGRAETELGQMAYGRAASPAVREFGMRMAQDHAGLNSQLDQILTQEGITEPAANEKAAMITDQLQSLNGADFDRACMRDMVKDDKKDIAEFKKEAAKGHDPELRGWAAQTLPTLEKHLQMAEQTESNLCK